MLAARKTLILLLLAALTGCASRAVSPSAASAPELKADPVYNYNKGQVAFDQKRYDEAADYFQRAIKLQPANSEYRFRLALVYFTTSRWDDAAATLQEALKINPYFTEARNWLGATLSEKGDRVGALAAFDAVLADRNYPTPEKAWVNKGLLYEQMGDMDQALTSYRRALDARGDYTPAHYKLAQLLDRMGKMPEAIAEYLVAARDYDALPEFHYKLGLAYFRAGQKDQAREQLQKVIQKAPGTTDASKAEDLLKLID